MERFSRAFSRGRRSRDEKVACDVTFPRLFVVHTTEKGEGRIEGGKGGEERERRENLDLGVCRAERHSSIENSRHTRLAIRPTHPTPQFRWRSIVETRQNYYAGNSRANFTRDMGLSPLPGPPLSGFCLESALLVATLSTYDPFSLGFISNKKNTSRLQWADHCLFSLSLSFLVTFGPGPAEANTLWFFSLVFLHSAERNGRRCRDSVTL
jgi:hypothetical protein